MRDAVSHPHYKRFLEGDCNDMNTPADIWKVVLTLLEKRLQPVTIDAWFDDLTAVEFKDDTLLLHTPDKFKKEIIFRLFTLEKD